MTAPVGIVALFVLAAGSGTVASESTGYGGTPAEPASALSVAPAESAATSEPEPLPDPFSEILGYDMGAMSSAVVRAQSDYVAACLGERGYEFDVTDNSLTVSLAGSESHPRDVIESIESGDVVPADELPPPDPAAEQAEAECLNEANVALPNPNGTLIEMLAEFLDDVSNRAGSDPRVVEAAQQRDACIGAVGYEPPEGVDPLSSIANQADLIMIDFQNGTVTRDDALEQLYALLPIDDALQACYAVYLEVSAVVGDEVWHSIIEENPGLVEAIRAAVADEVALYEEYL